MAANSTGDPDMDAVLEPSASAPIAPVASTGDADMDAVLKQPAATTSQEVPDTWWNAVKGVGESAGVVGSGFLKAVNKGANDILPDWPAGSRAKVANEIENDPVLNYRGGPEAQPILDVIGTATKPLADAAHDVHSIIALGAGTRAADMVSDVATLAPAVRDVFGSAEKAAATQDAVSLKRYQDAGYVVPPATTNPTVLNRVVEGTAGKLTTAQAASARNMEVTNNLVRQELKLPSGAPLTQETLQTVRDAQSPTYEALKSIPDIKFGPEYEQELDTLSTTAKKITSTLPKYRATGSEQVQQLVDSLKPQGGTMDGETAIELTKSLRAEAASQELTASRTGDPTARALARAYRGAGEAVENAIERHLQANGQPQLARQFDDARRTIAKTYSVQNALDGAGNVDATKLGKQLIKGKPLSGNLETAANFANAYPKAARVIKESLPGMSPLDVYGGAALEAGTGNMAGLLLGPARLAARSALLSPWGQRLATPGAGGLGSAVRSSVLPLDAAANAPQKTE
jgi:hypothetical protein